MSSKSLLVAVQETLRHAHEERATIERDRVRLDDLIAGLELVLSAQGEPPKVSAKPVNGTNGRARMRGPIAKRGEMEKAVLAAMSHYDGQAVSTSQIAKYLAAHRPPSLQRKQVNHSSWLRRANNALVAMMKRGDVDGNQIPGKGISLYWTRN